MWDAAAHASETFSSAVRVMSADRRVVSDNGEDKPIPSLAHSSTLAITLLYELPLGTGMVWVLGLQLGTCQANLILVATEQPDGRPEVALRASYSDAGRHQPK